MQFGIGEDTLQPPSISIPTKVYKDNGGAYTAAITEDVVYPINKGSIQDLEAFKYFIMLIYRSVLKEQSEENPVAWDTTLSNIPFLLISHHSWTQAQQEYLTRFVFEVMKINHFLVLPSALSNSFAFGSIQNCLIIDIGKQHTDLIPVMDYSQLQCFTRQISVGGQSINENLSELLPNLSHDQVEDLKCSEIYEILSNDEMERFAFSNGGTQDDEGALDVAAIVTSGRDTREILEERERTKDNKKLDNAKMETNTFFDRNENAITVGKQRFQGWDTLVQQISKATGQVLSQIDDIPKLRAMWENVIIVGGTSHIRGFKEVLIGQLLKDHLVSEPEKERLKREEDAKALLANKQKKLNKYGTGSVITQMEYSQVPTVILPPKAPEYFPEWKKLGFSDVTFLGAQVLSKQVFGHVNSSFYVTRESYDEHGPEALWQVSF